MGRRSVSSVKRNTRIESFFAYNGDDKLIIQWWMQREQVDMINDISWKDLNSYMVTQKKRKYGWEVLKTRWLEKIDKDLTDYCGGEVPSRESFGWKNELAEAVKWEILQQRLLIAREHVRNLGRTGNPSQHSQPVLGTVAQLKNVTQQQSQAPNRTEPFILGTPPNSSQLTTSPSPVATAALIARSNRSNDSDDDVVEIQSGNPEVPTTTPLSSHKNVFRSRRPALPHHQGDHGETQHLGCPGNIALVAAKDGVTALVLFGDENCKPLTQQLQLPTSLSPSQTYSDVVDPAFASRGAPQCSTPMTTNMALTCSPAETGMKDKLHNSSVIRLTSPATDSSEIENRTASEALNVAEVLNTRIFTREPMETLGPPAALFVKDSEHVSVIASEESSGIISDDSTVTFEKQSNFTLCSNGTAVVGVSSYPNNPRKLPLTEESMGTSARDIATTVFPVFQKNDEIKRVAKEGEPQEGGEGFAETMNSENSFTTPAESDNGNALGGLAGATLAAAGGSMEQEVDYGKRKNISPETSTSIQENSKKVKTNSEMSCLPSSSNCLEHAVEHEVRFPSRFTSNKPGAESTDVRGYQFPMQKFSGLEFYVVRKFEDPVDACKAVGREFLIRFYGGKVLKFLHQIGIDTICIASDEQDYNEQVATLIPGNIVSSSCLEQLARYHHQCTQQDFLGFSMWPTTVSEQYVTDGEQEEEEGGDQDGDEKEKEDEENEREEDVKEGKQKGEERGKEQDISAAENTTTLANVSAKSSHMLSEVEQDGPNERPQFTVMEEDQQLPSEECETSTTPTVKHLETQTFCADASTAEPANVPGTGEKQTELVRVFGIIAGIVNSDPKISYSELRNRTAELFSTRYGKTVTGQTIRHKVDRKRKNPEKLFRVLKLAVEEFGLTEEVIQNTVDYFGQTSADNN